MELIDIALGVVLTVIGAIAAVLAAFYWAGGGLTLLSFGLFTVGFGLTLLLGSDAVDTFIGMSPAARGYAFSILGYWFPVPGVMFAEQLRGPGWHSSLRRLWQAWIPLAATLTLVDIVTASPFAVGDLYRLFIIIMLVIVFGHVLGPGPFTAPAERRLRRWGSGLLLVFFLHDNLVALGYLPWQLALQSVGFTAFVGSLGLITAQRFFTNQRELVIVEHEMSTAREIQASILPEHPPQTDGLTVAVRYAPMRAVAGDFYDFVAVDNHRLGMLVADVTGHGVPAAMIASLSKGAFSAQADRAAAPGALLAGMNTALCGSRLERQFVTASYVFLEPEAGSMSYSGAGHLPPLLWRASSREVVELGGGGIFLGFLPDAEYPTQKADLRSGDRLLVYTDGVTEAADPAGRFFDEARLKQFVASNCGLGTEAFADALMARLRAWAGHTSTDQPFEDDVTLAVVDVV